MSIYLADRIAKRKYTAKACRQRVKEIIDGTALPAIELDADQEGRRILRDERIAARKTFRASLEQDKKDLEALRQARIDEQKEAKREKIRQHQAEILRKQDIAKEVKRLKDEKEATRRAARIAKEQHLEKMRLERDWEAEKIRVEQEIYLRITGKHLFGKAKARQRTPTSTPGKKQGATNYDWDTEEEEEDHDDMLDSASDEDADDEDDITRADSVANFTSKRIKRAPVAKRALPIRQARVSAAAKIRSTPACEPVDEMEDDIAVSTASTAPEQAFVKAIVTRESLLNPRSICTNKELRRTFLRREITPARQDEESHAEVVARLAEFDAALSVPQLREVCKSELLPHTGRKEQLVERLAEEDAANSFAHTEHKLKSTDLEFMMTYEGYEGENRIYLEEAKQAARDRGELVLEDSDDDMEA